MLFTEIHNSLFSNECTSWKQVDGLYNNLWPEKEKNICIYIILQHFALAIHLSSTTDSYFSTIQTFTRKIKFDRISLACQISALLNRPQSDQITTHCLSWLDYFRKLNLEKWKQNWYHTFTLIWQSFSQQAHFKSQTLHPVRKSQQTEKDSA